MTKILLSTKHIDDLKHIQSEIKKYSEKSSMDIFETDKTNLSRMNFKIASYTFDVEDMIDAIIDNISDGITRKELADLSEKVFMIASLENVKVISQPSIGSKEVSNTFLNLTLKIDEIIKDLKIQLVD